VKRVRVVVSGDVQGVGFRAATAREARLLGVTGWVRNQFDGTVEVHAEGKPEAIDSLITWLRRGPSLARVTGIDVAEALPDGDRGDFAIR
jgi:acylphosphatase